MGKREIEGVGEGVGEMRGRESYGLKVNVRSRV